MGPLLFIIYIIDIATVISPGSDANMFADDIALYIIKDPSDHVHLQEDIDLIGVFTKTLLHLCSATLGVCFYCMEARTKR